jgi:predicted nucleic acid-binding protein
LRNLLPADAVPWAPEVFYLECGAVLRRWDLNGVLPPTQIARAVNDLLSWPIRVTQVRGLFMDAWRLRANVTFGDSLYVALAEHLGADLLTDDRRLAATPSLPVRTLCLP